MMVRVRFGVSVEFGLIIFGLELLKILGEIFASFKKNGRCLRQYFIHMCLKIMQ